MVLAPTAAQSLRFGQTKRNWRDYSVKSRKFGLTSGDRLNILKIKRQLKVISFAIMTYEEAEECDDDHDNELRMSYFLLLRKLRKITKPNVPLPNPVKRRRVRLNYFNNDDCFEKTGFSIKDNELIYDLLEVPDNFVINKNQGDRRSFKVNGEHAYMYCMYRMHDNYHPFLKDEKEWGYSLSTLSKVKIHHHFLIYQQNMTSSNLIFFIQIFNVFTNWLDSEHSYRLRMFIHAPLSRFNAHLLKALRRKGIADISVPQELQFDAGVWDVSRWSVKRPSGPY